MPTTHHDGALRAWAEGMRQNRALGAFSDDEVAALVTAALDRARRDHAVYVAQRHARGEMMRSLRRIQRLADAAQEDAKGGQRLLDDLGDGRGLDHLLSLAMGYEMDTGTTAAAAVRGGASGKAVRDIATDVDFALRFASAGRGARRGAKFFAVLALAFAFVRLTGRVPTFTTVVVVQDEGAGKNRLAGKREGERVGDFVDLVKAAHVLHPIPDGDVGFGPAVVEALWAGGAMLDAAVTMIDLLDPLDQPAFGSPGFGEVERATHELQTEASIG